MPPTAQCMNWGKVLQLLDIMFPFFPGFHGGYNITLVILATPAAMAKKTTTGEVLMAKAERLRLDICVEFGFRFGVLGYCNFKHRTLNPERNCVGVLATATVRWPPSANDSGFRSDCGYSGTILGRRTTVKNGFRAFGLLRLFVIAAATETTRQCERSWFLLGMWLFWNDFGPSHDCQKWYSCILGFCVCSY